MVLSAVMKAALVLLLMGQLVAPNITIPQVMSAKFSSAAPIRAGRKANLTVSFILRDGYKINREPRITLNISPISGVKWDSTDIEASPVDRKATDEYYVDLPTLKIGVTAAKNGKYEIPGKLTYFFCSKSDGFCAKQVVDVKIPLQVE